VALEHFGVASPAVSGRYGFQQDELYFLVASHHLAVGYVDQPPLAVLLARTTDLFGVNPTAIRIRPALAGGAIVVLAALFDGGRAARVIAALTVAIAPVFLGAMHVGNTTPYDLLAWTVVTVCAAMALLRDRPRWWLGGVIAFVICVPQPARTRCIWPGIPATRAGCDMVQRRISAWFPALVAGTVVRCWTCLDLPGGDVRPGDPGLVVPGWWSRVGGPGLVVQGGLPGAGRGWSLVAGLYAFPVGGPGLAGAVG
jgi:Dolichyl-phosphate-mannose-protein mannosyltransferase